MSSQINTARWLRDGNLSFGAGVDASRNPADIDRNQIADGVNLTCRGGSLAPRNGLVRRPLTYSTNSAAKFFQRGLFQRASFYSGNGKPALISSHSGRQFKIDLLTFDVTEITPTLPETTSTTASVTVPTVGNTVQIAVLSTSGMDLDLPNVTLSGLPLSIVTIDDSTHLTVRNDIDTTESTTTTSNFTIPAVGGTVTVAVADSSVLSGPSQPLTIGGKSLTLVSVNSPTSITVSNTVTAQVGNVVTSPATAFITSTLGIGPGSVISSPATLVFNKWDINSPDKNLGWTLEAANYWIYQDNESYPIIFDGSSSRRSNPDKNEIPIGNVMGFSMYRIAVALQDRQTFRVGDLMFGSSGTPLNGYRDAILKFTENTYLNEGGDLVARTFAAPGSSGPIMSMKSGAMTDTQLGQGPLMVGTPNCIFTVQLPFDRTQWKNLTQPLQTVNLIKGPTGQDSTVLVNTDTWYRANDNTVRSYALARREFMTWGNTGQSNELGDLLSFDSAGFLEHASGVLFDNRLLITVSPVKSDHGVYHRGLVALDFNLITNIRGKTSPAWEGVWTGLQILMIVSGVVDGNEKCFIYSLSSDNHIELWELDPISKTDDGERIRWSFDSPSYNFGDADQYKRLEYGRFVLQKVDGSVDWNVSYRTDTSPCLYPWDSGTICAKTTQCGPFDCTGPLPTREQERTPVKLTTPPDDADRVNGHLDRCGYEFQARIQMTGWAQLRQIRVYAKDEPEVIAMDPENAT